MAHMEPYEAKKKFKERDKQRHSQSWRVAWWKTFYLSGKRQFCMKQGNRIIRQDKDFHTSGAAYRRKFDLWWTLY